MKVKINLISILFIFSVSLMSCQMGNNINQNKGTGSLCTSFRSVSSFGDNSWNMAEFNATAVVTLKNVADENEVYTKEVKIPDVAYFDGLKIGSVFEISVEVSGDSDFYEIEDFFMGKGTATATVKATPEVVSVSLKRTVLDSVQKVFNNLSANEEKEIVLESDLLWDDYIYFTEVFDSNESKYVPLENTKVTINLNGHSIYNVIGNERYMIEMDDPGLNAGLKIINGKIKGNETSNSSGVINSVNQSYEHTYLDVENVIFENMAVSVIKCNGGKNSGGMDADGNIIMETQNIHLSMKNCVFSNCGTVEHLETNIVEPMLMNNTAALMLGTAGSIFMENVSFVNCVYAGAGAMYFDGASSVLKRVDITECNGGIASSIWQGNDSTAILTDNTTIVSGEIKPNVSVGNDSFFVMIGASIKNTGDLSENTGAVFLGNKNATLAMVDNMKTESGADGAETEYFIEENENKISVPDNKYAVWAEAGEDSASKIALSGNPQINGVIYLGANGNNKATVTKVGDWNSDMSCTVEPAGNMVFQLKKDLKIPDTEEYYKVGAFDVQTVSYADASSHFNLYSSKGNEINWTSDFENATEEVYNQVETADPII